MSSGPMSGGGRGRPDLEQRYRRVLRLLPGYYRDAWEADMVAAFLDSWLTGDPETDERVLRFCRPSLPEKASVAGLAARLYLGGAGAPRRYFAWGQAVRGAVLAVLLANALAGLGQLLFLARSRDLIGWLPVPPGGLGTTVSYLIGGAWVAAFLALVLRDYRSARALGGLAAAGSLVLVVNAQVTGIAVSPLASWAHWVLIEVVPVLALAAFHRDAPPPARRAWLLALAACFLLVLLPLLALEASGHQAWVPDNPGVACLLVSLVALAHAPRAWSARPGSGVWSLTVVLLAAVAGLDRIASLTLYRQDPHLIKVGLVELLILAVATVPAALDAGRAQITLSPPSAPSAPGLG
jgi:hypothetical protein